MYRDANGIEHESYDAACRYYGADTPDDCAREMAAIEAEERAAEDAALAAEDNALALRLAAEDNALALRLAAEDNALALSLADGDELAAMRVRRAARVADRAPVTDDDEIPF